MAWIRIDIGIADDPRTWALAADVRKDVGAVVGYVTCLLRKLPEHARTGDLAGIPDGLLEQWALWPGKAGTFARAFFAHFCDGRQVRAWQKHNGAPLKELDEKREHMREIRDQQKRARRGGNATATPETVTPTVTPTVGDTVPDDAPERYAPTYTVRNETVRNGVVELQQQLIPADADAPPRDRGASRPRAAKAARPAPDAEPPLGDCAATSTLYEIWVERKGEIAFPRFRKAFGPLVEPRGERPARHPVLLIAEALRRAIVIAKHGGRAHFLTPESFVADLADHIEVARLSPEAFLARVPERRNGTHAGIA